MTRICLIDNMAALYRKGIYLLMEKEWDVSWYFGEPINGIQSFDTSILRKVHILKTKYRKHIPGYWLENMSEALDDNEVIIMIGEPALWSTWSLLFKNLFLRNKRKIYFWTHGWYGKEGKIKSFIKKIYFNLGTGIITYGNYARELMIKEGFAADKIVAIHNSLDYDTQLKLRNTITPTSIYTEHFRNNNPNLIFIGRLAKYKKLHLLIDALHVMRENSQNYNLTIIGNGECNDELHKQVEHLGLSENVWFYGACYDEKLNADLIFNADLCVSPGNVGLNAVHTLMFGTPVITHSNYPYQGPEFEAIKEGLTGSFFKHDNVTDLARCISEWFATSHEREAIRKACYNEIDTNWTPTFQIEVLRKVLSQ